MFEFNIHVQNEINSMAVDICLQPIKLFFQLTTSQAMDSEIDRAHASTLSLRTQSIVLASYPWFSSLIMTRDKISEELGSEHYAYVCLIFF